MANLGEGVNMAEVEDLLRELVAEARVQSAHLVDVKTSMATLATKDDIEHSEKLRSQEHKQILAKAGNGHKDTLLLLTVSALIVLAGAASALTIL